MPNGMSFTVPGAALNIAERGFDKALVLERNTGIMLSGRDMGLGNDGKVNGLEMGHERPWQGFGYDVMIANQASRSKMASSSPMGGNSYAVRGMFDYTEKFHIETSYGKSESAGGPNTKDYTNVNVGIDSNLGKLSLKAEYFDAKNLKGTVGKDQKAFTATIGYFVTPALELSTKHIQGDANWGNSANNTSLGNTYLGFNYFIYMPNQDFSRNSKKSRNKHKVVFNYIIASGDSGGVDPVTGSIDAGKWNGEGGYRENAFIVQYQFIF